MMRYFQDIFKELFLIIWSIGRNIFDWLFGSIEYLLDFFFLYRVMNNLNGVTYGDATVKVVPFAENHGGRYKYRSNSIHDMLPTSTSPVASSSSSFVYPFRYLITVGN